MRVATLFFALASVTDAAKRSVISTPDAPAAIGPYSQAIAIDYTGGRHIHAAGQIGMDPATGELVAGGIVNESKRAMTNVQNIMKKGGASMDNVTECTVLLADLGEYSAFNDVYATFFQDEPPARAAFQVVALPKGARTEVKCAASI